MNPNQLEELKILFERGCTDSDLIEFCEDNNLSVREVYHTVASWIVPECCNGCKYIEFYSGMYPCNNCSRPKKDMYEKEKD